MGMIKLSMGIFKLPFTGNKRKTSIKILFAALISFQIFVLASFAIEKPNNDIEKKYLPDKIIIKTIAGAINMPSNVYSLSVENAGAVMPTSLKEKNLKFKVKRVRRMFTKQKTPAGITILGKKAVQVPDLSNYYIIEVPEDVSIESMVEEYKNDSNIEQASPDYLSQIFKVPNDPGFKPYKWPDSTQWGLFKICAPAAWDYTTGNSSQVIAVIDTGVNYNHEDLAGKVILGPDYVNNDNDPMDDHGHGTHVSGIAAAITNNGKGVAGVNWNSKILAIKAFDSNGCGCDDAIIRGIQYASEHGAEVINMSFGGPYYDPAIQDIINYAYAQGCVLIAAAGNGNTSVPAYPAACDHVIAVAATDKDDNRTSYSNYGPWVDVAAPGGAFWTYDSNGGARQCGQILSCGLGDHDYVLKCGTSMAAPFVSGAASLVFSVTPDASPDEVENILKAGVDQIPDKSIGIGRINIGRSLFNKVPPLPQNMPLISDFAFDCYGCMYVVYCREGKVVKYDQLGREMASVSGFANVPFFFPWGIACSPDGYKVYVSDTYNNRITIFNYNLQGIGSIYGEGAFSLFVCREVYEVFLWNVQKSEEEWKEYHLPGEGFECPKGVSVDNNGYLYVADSLKGRILKYDGNGNPNRFGSPLGSSAYEVGRTYLGYIWPFMGQPTNIWLFGHKVYSTRYSNAIMGSFDQEFNYASSVFAHKSNQIYISDTMNNRIQSYNYDGSFNKIIKGIDLNMPSSSYLFTNQTSGEENLYIADKGNSRIQRYGKNYNYICTYGDKIKSPSPLKALLRDENGRAMLYFCDAKMKTIQSHPADLPPSDFNTTIPLKGIYYINNKGMDISWLATHESDFIKVNKYQIVGKRSDLDYWEAFVDNIPSKANNVHFSIPREGNWLVNVRASNGTAFRDSDGYGQIGEALKVTGDITSEGRIPNREIKVVADFTPPSIYDFYIYEYYSPLLGNMEGTFKVVDLGSSELQSINAYVYDKQNNLVKFLFGAISAECGTLSLIWDGNDELGNMVSDGDYKLFIRATDKAGNEKEESKPITVDTVSPLISNESYSTSLITPNDDGVNDDTNISFSVSEPSDVSVMFRDTSGKLLRQIDLFAEKDAVKQVTWDGKNYAGEVVTGKIEVYIRAIDYAGNKTVHKIRDDLLVELSSNLMEVQASPEVMSLVITNPKPVTFNYSIPDTCTIEAYITNQGANIYTIVPLSVKQRDSYQTEWYGKDEGGNKMKEGSYNYVFSAVTPNKTMTKKGIVRIDNTSPYVSQIMLSPQEESVQSLTIMTDDFTLSYYLSDKCSVTIDILDPFGLVVSNLLSDQLQEPKGKTLSFEKDKLLIGGQYLTGTYTIRFKLVDEAGNEYTNEQTKLVVISGFKISSAAAVPPAFTPDAEYGNRSTLIKYSIAGGAGEITSKVKIKTLGGATIKEFRSTHGSCPISDYEEWLGDDENKNPLTDGQYKFEVSAVDSTGNETDPVEGDITLIRNSSVSMFADPTEFSPNGDDFMDICKIYYTVNYHGRLMEGNSHIEATIYNSDNDKVYYFSDSKDEGNYFHIWDATNSVAGGKVPDGTYSLKVVASDPVNTPYVYVTDIIVDRGPPNVSDEGVTEPIITPNGDGQQDETTLKYHVLDVGTRISSIEVLIFNSATTFDSTTTVRSLIGSVNGDTVWDGSVNVRGGNGDADGNGYADKGMYKYVVKARDVLGNVRFNVSSFEVQVDKVYLSFVPPTNNPSEPYFSPNDDGVKDSTEISFSLMTTQESYPYYLLAKTKKKKIMASTYCVGRITMEVKNSSGTTVKTLMNAESCHKDQTYTVTWDGTDASGVKVPDGLYTIEVTAADMVGDPATGNLTPASVVDTVIPVASITSPLDGSWQKGTIDIRGTINDPSPVIYSVGYDNSNNNIGTGEGNKSNNTLASWNTSGIGKTCTIELYVVDAAGNTGEAHNYYHIDNDPPIISNIQVKSNGQIRNYFNPYVDNSISMEFQLDENSLNTSNYSEPATYLLITAEVYANTTKIKTIRVADHIQTGLIQVGWTGLNDNTPNDYVNEGTYIIRGIIRDICSNTVTFESSVTLADDQRLPNSGNCFDTYLSLSGNNMFISWANSSYEDWAGWVEADGQCSNGDGVVRNTPSFTLDLGDSQKPVTVEKYENGGGSTDYKIYRETPPNGNVYWNRDANTVDVNIGPGTFHGVVDAQADSGHAYSTRITIYYWLLKYNRYSGSAIGPNFCAGMSLNIVYNGYVDDYYPTPTNQASYNGMLIHKVTTEASGGYINLCYLRSANGGAGWTTPVKLTHSSNVYNPTIVCDSNSNAYVAWEDTRNGPRNVYFQKIPYNFAPINSPGMTIMALPKRVIAPIIMSGASTIELISPIGGTTVKDLRPTFRWYGITGWKDYRVECATTSEDIALSGSLDYFTTTISDVSSPKPICEYLVPEHSMGLDESDSSRPFWYWRVKTANTSEVTTSEVGSFRIDLPLSLSGVTNWPNPFDPNSEKTKIRYRLGREPDSVTIRIYDITGALVREMDGTCNAEGASIWNKYNDVEWDGRNGRGDIVLNGVYPFEVIVEGGNKTVSGRGKIVVLK